jgi:predicted Holliday junction resolvase-like endonuclease
MNALIITLLIVNVVVTVGAAVVIAKEQKKLNKRIDSEVVDIGNTLNKNTLELKLARGTITNEVRKSKDEIKQDIKKEVREQIIKWVFTPIKLNMRG